jgi:hypothetical protein
MTGYTVFALIAIVVGLWFGHMVDIANKELRADRERKKAQAERSAPKGRAAGLAPRTAPSVTSIPADLHRHVRGVRHKQGSIPPSSRHSLDCYLGRPPFGRFVHARRSTEDVAAHVAGAHPELPRRRHPAIKGLSLGQCSQARNLARA